MIEKVVFCADDRVFWIWLAPGEAPDEIVPPELVARRLEKAGMTDVAVTKVLGFCLRFPGVAAKIAWEQST